MEHRNVTSSDLRSVGYDEGTQTLGIQFHSGGLYEYYNVPVSVYRALMGATSPGTFFHAKIKDNYRYRRVR